MAWAKFAMNTWLVERELTREFKAVAPQISSGVPIVVEYTRSCGGSDTFVKAVHPIKASDPMYETVSGIITDFKFVQLAKAPELIVLTPVPINKLVSPEQPLKVEPFMISTLPGMVMEDRLVHEPKAPAPILVTLVGIVTENKFVQLKKEDGPKSVTIFGMLKWALVLLFGKAKSAV